MKKRLIILVPIIGITFTGGVLGLAPSKPKPQVELTKSVTKPKVEVKTPQVVATQPTAPAAPAAPVDTPAPAPTAYETQMKLECENKRIAQMASVQAGEDEVNRELVLNPGDPNLTSQLTALQNQYSIDEARTC